MAATAAEPAAAPVAVVAPVPPAAAIEQRQRVQAGVDAVARESFTRQRPSAGWHPRSDVDIPALRTAILVMMVKDEADIIGQNLAHHFRLGFRYFFLLDNGSTDATAAVIERFRAEHTDAMVFCGFDFVVGYYQAAKMQAVLAFLSIYLEHEEHRSRWVFFVDADEFITFCAGEPGGAVAAVTSLLEDPAKQMLVLHWAQCSSDEVLEHDTPERSLLETHTRIWKTMEPAVTKVAIRLDSGLTMLQGNHMAAAFPYELEAAGVLARFGVYMLHFPQRSVEQMRRKVVNGAAAYAAAKGQEGHGGHWRQYYEWYSQAGDIVLRQLIQAHIDSCT